MSNAQQLPANEPPSERIGGGVRLDYEDVPSTGVRKALEAVEKRDVQRIRWGSVVAGLVIAIAVQAVLGLLGVAIGLSALPAQGLRGTESLTLKAGLWIGVGSLIALFLGGYIAAKFGGAIRKGDGVFSGVLTWSTSLVLSLVLLGGGASAVLASSPSREMPAARMNIPGVGRGVQADDISKPLESSKAVKAVWYTFGGTCLTLFAAMIGGALGAVGTREPRSGSREASREATRHARERDREIMKMP